MAPKPIPMPSAAVVDANQLATVDWFSYWKSVSDATNQNTAASKPSTGSPLYAQSLGWNYVPSGDVSCVLAGFAIFPRYGFGSIWVAVADLAVAAIVRIDPTTGRVIATISAGPPGTASPTSVCITDTRVYFNEAVSGRVGYVDPTTNTLTYPPALTGLGAAMRGMCWDGSHVWAGIAVTAGSAKKIDPATNTVVATVALGNTPFIGPAFDGVSHVWWPNFNDNTVSRININTNVVDQTIATLAGPWGLFCDGLRMYVSENGADSIASYAIGNVANSGRWTLPAGSGLHDIVVVGNELWVTQSSQDKIFVFDILGENISTPTAIRNFSVGPAQSDPAGLCFDGHDIWWVNAQGDTFGTTGTVAAKVQRRRIHHRF